MFRGMCNVVFTCHRPPSQSVLNSPSTAADAAAVAASASNWVRFFSILLPSLFVWVSLNFWRISPESYRRSRKEERNWKCKSGKNCRFFFCSLPRARVGPEMAKCFHFLLLQTLDHLMYMHRHILFPNHAHRIVYFSNFKAFHALDCNTRLILLHAALAVCMFLFFLFYFSTVPAYFPCIRMILCEEDCVWMRISMPIWTFECVAQNIRNTIRDVRVVNEKCDVWFW